MPQQQQAGAQLEAHELLDAPTFRLYADFVRRCAAQRLDLVELNRLARTCVEYARATARVRLQLRGRQQLERRWYASVAAGQPDLDVYSAPAYLADLWADWIVHSRTYLRQLRRARTPEQLLLDDLAPVSTIVDLGAGLGYTSAALRVLFPAALVVATELAGTPQAQALRLLSKQYDFAVASEVRELVRSDLVCAFGYLEQQQSPVAHLYEVLERTQPRALLVAADFGANAVGRFYQYEVAGQALDGIATAREVVRALAQAGYTKVATDLRHGRPVYYKK